MVRINMQHVLHTHTYTYPNFSHHVCVAALHSYSANWSGHHDIKVYLNNTLLWSFSRLKHQHFRDRVGKCTHWPEDGQKINTIYPRGTMNVNPTYYSTRFMQIQPLLINLLDQVENLIRLWQVTMWSQWEIINATNFLHSCTVCL